MKFQIEKDPSNHFGLVDTFGHRVVHVFAICLLYGFLIHKMAAMVGIAPI